MGHNRKCRVTVLECQLNGRLAKKFDPGVEPCPLFSEGQEFVLDQNGPQGYWHLMGGTFCSEAWAAISNYVDTILQCGVVDSPSGDNYKICCCPDGIRPVVFKVELVER